MKFKAQNGNSIDLFSERCDSANRELRVLNGESPMKTPLNSDCEFYLDALACRPGCHKSGLKFSIAIRKELLSKHPAWCWTSTAGSPWNRLAAFKSPAQKVGGVVLWSV